MTKITAEHLARTEPVSTSGNRQQTSSRTIMRARRRQYGLVDRAKQLGWSNVEVIDDDLGRSGGGTARPGFERRYVRKHPVATKRVLRAFIKATDFCVGQPELVAQQIVNAGFTPRYDYALQALKEIPYGRWREYDPAAAISCLGAFQPPVAAARASIVVTGG